MAEKLLKAKKQKIAAKKCTANGDAGVDAGRAAIAPNGRAASTKPPQEIALVATYREKQLAWIKKNGVYNYPAKDGDEFDAAAFGQIRELWLYAGSKGKRHCFEAEFVSKMTREEFIAAYPTYAKISLLAKSENREYYVFKTSFLDYGPKLEDPLVVARGADFGGRSAKVKKAIEAFKQGGEFGSLADFLPSELSQVPRQQLRVCEAAVQMDFFGVLNVKVEALANRTKEKNSMVQPDPKTLCKSIADYSKITVKAFGQRNLFSAVEKATAADDIRVVELFAGVGGFRIGLERKAA